MRCEDVRGESVGEDMRGREGGHCRKEARNLNGKLAECEAVRGA